MYRKSLFALACILPLSIRAVTFDGGMDLDRDNNSDLNVRINESERDRYYDHDHRRRNQGYNRYDSYQSKNRGQNQYFSDSSAQSNPMRDKDLKNLLNNFLRSFGLEDQGQGLRVDVQNGVVTIRGQVQNRKDFRKVMRLFDTLEEVRFRENISISNTDLNQSGNSNNQQRNQNYMDNSQSSVYQPDSEMIVAYAEGKQDTVSQSGLKRKIKDELTNSWFSDYENIQVSVNNGVVTLTGIVENESDLDNVEERIREIRGVKMVKNNLSVSSSEGDMNSRRLSDGQIKKKIKDKLQNTWWGSYDNVNVEVDNGIVILRGHVEEKDDITDIQGRLEEVPGVKVIRTRIQVQE